eukprot:364905-Chlamydomonas_euryale.AAC.14
MTTCRGCPQRSRGCAGSTAQTRPRSAPPAARWPTSSAPHPSSCRHARASDQQRNVKPCESKIGYLPVCLPDYLPACPPAYLPAHPLARLPAWLPVCLPDRPTKL